MKRLHVNLKVRDLEESVGFYSELFASDPTTVRPRYAKWMLDDPRVNFSLVETADREAQHGIEHLGIEAETPSELAELRDRIGRLQGEVFDEGETVCCYHASDKTWVTDAHGVSWEAFHTSGEADSLGGSAPGAEGECCEDNCCA